MEVNTISWEEKETEEIPGWGSCDQLKPPVLAKEEGLSAIIKGRGSRKKRRNYECTLCPAEFWTYELLWEHRKLNHSRKERHHREDRANEAPSREPGREEEIRKESLGNRSASRPSTKRGKARTSGEMNPIMKRNLLRPNLPCLFCSKQLPYYSSLESHMNMHTRERPYDCLLCGAVFSHSDSLARHNRKRVRETGFPCAECSKIFCNPMQLKLHQTKRTCTIAQVEESRGSETEIGKVKPQGGESRQNPGITKGKRSSQKNVKGDKRTKGTATASSSPVIQNAPATPHQSVSTQQCYKCSFCPKTFNSATTVYRHKKRTHPQDENKAPSHKRTTARGSKVEPNFISRVEVDASVAGNLPDTSQTWLDEVKWEGWLQSFQSAPQLREKGEEQDRLDRAFFLHLGRYIPDSE